VKRLQRKDLTKTLALAGLMAFIWLQSSVQVFAETPTPIVVSIKEEIEVVDSINTSTNNIENSSSVGATSVPDPVKITIKEKINVGDSVNTSTEDIDNLPSLIPTSVPDPIKISIEENINVGDSVTTVGGTIEGPVQITPTLTPIVISIKENLQVGDGTTTSAPIPTMATPQPKPTIKPTATMVPTATKKPTATMRSRTSGSRGTTTTRAPIIFSPGSKSGPSVTRTPQATNKYGRAPVVTSKSSKQPVTSAASKQPEQKKAVTSKAPARRTFGNFFGFRSSSSKDDDKKTTTSRSSSSRSRFSLVGRATGEDETQSDGQGDMAEESTSGSCASTSAREGVSVLAMLMLPLVIVNRKRLGL